MISGPDHVMFEFTYRCNSRCIMCTIWKDKQADMDGETIKRFFKDPLIRENLKSIGITGGEPTLRDDLAELIDFALDSCPKVENLYMTTNGFSMPRVQRTVSSLISVIASKKRRIRLWINVSLDGLGKTHELVRRVPDAFKKTNDALDYLISLSKKNSDVRVGVKMTVCSQNYFDVKKIYTFAMEKGISASHMPAIDSGLYFQKDISSETNFGLKRTHKEIVAKDFESLYNLSGNPYYLMAANVLRGGKRSKLSGCLFPKKSVYVGANGDVSLCFLHEDFVYGNITKDSFTSIWEKLDLDAIERDLWSRYCPTCMASCVNDPKKTVKYSILSSLYFLVKPYVDDRISVKTKNRLRKIATCDTDQNF